MKGIIRVGDSTTHGGKVLAGGQMGFGGRKVARKGDPVSCPKEGHGDNVIVEGHPTIKDHGIPVAFEGYRCACGCTLISSLKTARAD